MNNTLYSIHHLTKEYGDKESTVRALDSIDLDISKGDFVAVTGISGSGKSTFLNILAGLTEITDGDVLFKGENMSDWSDRQCSSYRNQSIGYVVQNYGLINTYTVLENVLMPVKKNKKAYKDRAVSLLNDLGLHDKVQQHPFELSGGQKQRCAIARALINTPAVILADEPTGALDIENARMILDIFKQINDKGTTIILVTHQEEMARKCRHWIKFSDGRIIENNM